MRIIIMILMAMLLTTTTNAQFGSGGAFGDPANNTLTGDLEVSGYSIDGDTSLGLYIDPDNDGVNEVTIDAGGKLYVSGSIQLDGTALGTNAGVTACISPTTKRICACNLCE